ncbi:MAG: leucine-rich repeat domain-containing protein, partial [Cytophagales bacterium]|nr:leucine-rich repeat domain-containing protein [Cytophagales bacterium]
LTINKINGTIPPSIGTLTKLKQIQLGTNLIEGNIPTSLGNLIQLDLLIMNDNKLTGSIPNEIGNLVNLRSFSIMRNLITGVIPVTLGNLTKLESLDLRNNQLSGTIPSELGNLTALTTLWLNSNKLTGSIPPTLGNLANLSSMYLDTNLLSGSIPSELGNLSKLTILYLNTNQLTGTLPPELGQLSSLRLFIVSNNKFTGTIPESFKNLKKIENFSIQINLFSGELPSNLFDQWTSLTTLNLHVNNFTGSFPSLSNISNITSLFAYDNEFTSFPLYLDHHLLLNYVHIHDNKLRNVPNLSNHPNKANLRINYQYNFLLPGNLEALYTGLGTHAFKSLASLPQNLENKVMGLPSGSELNVSFPDYSNNNTVIWEKLIGTTWTDVSSQDQSTSKSVFLIPNANSSHTGKYRFKITNPKFTSPFIGGVTEIVLTD